MSANSEPSGHSILKQSCTRHESTVRRLCVAVVFGIVLQLIVAEYAILNGRRDASRAEGQVLEEAKASSQRVKESLKKLDLECKSIPDELQRGLRISLEDRFRELKSIVDGDSASQTIGSRALRGELNDPSARIQSDPNTRLFDETTVAKIREALPNDNKFDAVVAEVVNELVLGALRSDYETQWKEEQYPEIRDLIGGVSKEVQDAKATYPQGVLVWNEIDEWIGEWLPNVSEFQIEYAVDDTWWKTVEGKRGWTSEQARELTEKLQGKFFQDSGLDSLIQNVSNSLDDVNAEVAILDDQIAGAAKSLEELQNRTSTLARPLQFLALDLDFVTDHSPILLGIALCVSLLFLVNAEMQRERAFGLFRAHDDDLVAWCKYTTAGDGQRRWVNCSTAWLAMGAIGWIAFDVLVIAVSGKTGLVLSLSQGIVASAVVGLILLYRNRSLISLRSAMKNGTEARRIED